MDTREEINRRIIKNGELTKLGISMHLRDIGEVFIREIEKFADRFIEEAELPLKPEDAMNFVSDYIVANMKHHSDEAAMMGGIILAGEITKRLNA